jgi:2-polyprenyl-6-methoxyphenol hydroxylase-like FAD-dependent oxidoreductase
MKQAGTYDVIIAGAGPVGLFLACELALARCSVLVLEKSGDPQSPLKRIPFGIRGLSTPTIEALDRRGLLPELEIHQRLKDPHKGPVPVQGAQPRRQGGHFAGIPFLDSDIDASQWKHRLPSSTAPSLISEMQELETILTRRAEALGVEIERGLALSSFRQDEAGVTVQAGERSFKGQWLVGCDGARSIVRKAGAFEFAGTEPEFTGYSTLLDIADPEKLGMGRVLTSQGMYMQSQPGYVIMQDFDGGAFHRSEAPITLGHLQEVLRRLSGTDVTIEALHVASSWTDRARQATAYRQGRLLLAGDAAHIHAPLGGQGLNLGLGDAMNLGWKLAASIQKRAPEGLLDSYQAERHPLGEQVLDWSRAQVALMRPSPDARALNAIIRDLMGTRDGATYFAGRVWGVLTRYDLGGGHPLVGCSVPNFELEDGSTIGQLMHDGRGMLLDLGPGAPLRTLVDGYGGWMKHLAGRAKEAWGLSAVLIRPDGIVAWASEEEPDGEAIRQAASPWFGR